jgi:hypothetical protein
MSASRFYLRAVCSVIAAAASTALVGCATTAGTEPTTATAFSTPANRSGDASLGGIRRVIVLPLWIGAGTPPETAASLDPIFLTALQQEKRFEVVALSREECRRRYGADALSSASALPHDLFATLRRDFAADAVLFVDLTAYYPYKPITLGLRGKLAAIEDSRLVWTFDNVYSAESSIPSNSFRDAVVEQIRGIPNDVTRTAIQSPAKFAAHAAASMFATLPPVTASSTIIAK